MSLISLALAAAAANAAPIVGTACPASNRGRPLTDAQVYSGPIAERAILVPDGERQVRGTTVSSWAVGYVYDRGQNVHLTCGYPDRPEIVVRITRRVSDCRLTQAGARNRLACT